MLLYCLSITDKSQTIAPFLGWIVLYNCTYSTYCSALLTKLYLV